MPRPLAIFTATLALTTLALALTPRHVIATSTAHARGTELFETKGCAHCHGANGINGERGPDLQQVRNRLSAAQIIHQIHDGSMGMPAFGDDLSTQEIDDLVAYLRVKRKVIIKPLPPPPAPKPDPDAN